MLWLFASAVVEFVLQMSGTTSNLNGIKIIHVNMEDRKMFVPKALSGSRVIAIIFLSVLLTA